MPQLERLKGTDGKIREAVLFHQAYEIRQILKDKKAATAAGDRGAINIYYDDAGVIRCEIMRYCSTVEEKMYNNITRAIEWAKIWLPQIGL